ncbi:hypothetical protein [Sphingobium yanoikuyae]|uniref:hypothetical protein n=1 Tax=Sphingobium yanoikuyae TaxID=13690 RepID=UPI0028AA8DAC|nr:hypothetical protein [Sphingobium yanoikuyae]
MAEPQKIYGMNLSIEDGLGNFVPIRPIEQPVRIKPLDMKLEFKCDFPAETMDAWNALGAEHAKVHAECLQAETDRWCWKAIAQGVRNRVWRSDPVVNDETFAVTYQFMILTPGMHPPAKGIIFGLFSSR